MEASQDYTIIYIIGNPQENGSVWNVNVDGLAQLIVDYERMFWIDSVSVQDD